VSGRKEPTAATRAAQSRVAASLPVDDGVDLASARRGFIGSIPDAAVGGSWSMAPYGFLEEPAPDSANPSLWRQARLNALHGLFEVTPGITRCEDLTSPTSPLSRVNGASSSLIP
jgi:alkyl sulfatase BDS1-like metallo-beta-lactamase superfamily hydrolase